MVINKIEEEDYILDFLIKRNLLNRYKKAKEQVLSGNYSGNKLKYRNPKGDGIIYFRINKQFRAFCHLEADILVVFKIDNHQN